MSAPGRTLLALVLPLLAAGCGGEPPAPPLAAERVLGTGEPGLSGTPSAGALTVDRPLDGAVYPPGFVPPLFRWHDVSESDTWLVAVGGGDPGALRVVVRGDPAPERRVDPRAVGETNEPYEPTPYQASARTWTPSSAVWSEIQERSAGHPVEIRIDGFVSSDPATIRSSGRVALTTSGDPVGAPILYRDVPLMPSVGEEDGVIRPLADNSIPLIEWRLRDVTKPESRLLLTDMPSCANCHSASLDGSTFGMDVDGPQGDKGTYALTPLERNVVIEYDDVITWNAFPDKPEGHKTIGFLSRISPDGRYVVSTVNEALYVSNFTDHEFLQVFYPTRGILAWYSRETGEMQGLPGADDPEYVHTNGVWTPDGETIVFSRARARDPYTPGVERAKFPNDPHETPIQYDLYRMPFDEGRGGVPVPVEGASANGMSNTFPKVSPDGRWIVFTKCRNGQLMRPDGRLWIVPLAGGEAREMRCNTSRMNSWHSFSPNGHWMVFSSKVDTPYTQMYLTHIDEDGNDSPHVLIPNSTAANRAVNIPEFVNIDYDDFQGIDVPAVRHHRFFWTGFDLLSKGRTQEAIEMLEKALALEPDWGRAHVSLGSALAREGRTQGAMQHFREAIRLDEHGAAAHFNLGALLYGRGQLGPAAKHLERALASWPTIPDGESNLALVLEAQGDVAGALVHLHRAVDQEPHDVKSRLRLVDLYFANGRPETGFELLEDGVQRLPSNDELATALAWRLATTRDDGLRNGARARDLARRICERTGYGEPRSLDALAAAYAELGRFDDAVETARRALSLPGPPHPEGRQALQGRIAGYEAHRPHRTP